jgi:protein-tyrosine phosphatase
MVDIHCHILPGIDDGSKSWDMTKEMCRVAAADGIHHIVATPHCNDQFAYDRQRYEAMIEELREAAGQSLEFSLGCDFHFSYDNISNAIADPRRYTIGGTPYLLIEFSDYSIPPSVKDQIWQLTSKGMVPIVTHPERNPLLVSQPEKILDLIDAGALVQVTANSITGFWGAKAKSVAEWLLQRGAVHVVASDAHDQRHRRPVLSEARRVVTQLFGHTVANDLFCNNPQAIVEGRAPAVA